MSLKEIDFAYLRNLNRLMPKLHLALHKLYLP